MDDDILKSKIKKAKLEVLDLCVKAGYGHPSSAYSLSEILAVLYYEFLRFDLMNTHWEMRDRLIISNNHASVMLFPILHDLGFISDDEYSSIMNLGSERTSHTNIRFPGMEFTGGSLGIGLGVAAGIAMASKLDNLNFLTVCIVGDAECCEGSIWEAAMFAGHNHLNNLIVIYDNNNMGVTDYTEQMIGINPIADKWQSFNFETKRINGHDLLQIRSTLSAIRFRSSTQPLCIIADTIKGHGCSIMENKLFWHGVVPKDKNLELAYKSLKK